MVVQVDDGQLWLGLYLFVSSIVDGLVRSSTSCCSNEEFFALPGVFMGCAMAIGLVIPAESCTAHRPL
jgi:hypothetical protein